MKKIDFLNFGKLEKKGFTLAEVLITLGIIGIVAAMTLPTLISNHNKKVYVTRLKKSVSVWEQAFQKMLADDGVDDLRDTELYRISENSTHGECQPEMYFWTQDTGCKAYFDLLKNKYLTFNMVDLGHERVVSSLDILAEDNSTANNSVQLLANDGTYVYFYNFWEDESRGYWVIDVNGNSKPNQMGRDIFIFKITKNGHLVAIGSDSAEGIFTNGKTWKEDFSLCGEPGKTIAKNSEVSGEGCAARIIENGWEMDY